jgi:hypothetical protein
MLERTSADAPNTEPASDETRPTVLPPFDTGDYARESERRLGAPRPASGETTTEEARQLLHEGKPEEALVLLNRLLDQVPLDGEARTLSNACGAAVERECWCVIGSRSTVLCATASVEELKGFGLDSISGFLLSLMDRATHVETLLDVAGLPRLVALRHLRRLVSRGIATEYFRPRT